MHSLFITYEKKNLLFEWGQLTPLKHMWPRLCLGVFGDRII